MKKMLKYKFLILFLLFQAILYSQDYQKINNEFNIAVRNFQNGNYNRALQIFEWISNDNQTNPKTTISLLFKGKTELKLSKYNDSISSFNLLMTNFPNSKYLNEAKIALSKALIGKNDYGDAMEQLVDIIENSNQPYYVHYSKITGKKLALNFLNSGQLIKLLKQTKSKIAKPYLLYLLGQVFYKEGYVQSSKNSFKEILNLYPKSEEKDKALNLYNNGGFERRTSSSETIIGVMLPLLNDNLHSPPQEILNGIKFAVAEYNKNNEQKIGIIVRNTERNREKIYEIRDEFKNNPAIKVVIGPLFSDEVKYATRAFENTDIPLISPTATANDITNLNSRFFQANPSFEKRGELLANYAFIVDSMRIVAILKSKDTYSSELASGFAKEFTRLGGEVWADVDYKSGSFNFRNSVDEINQYRDTLDCIYIPVVNKIDAEFVTSNLVLDSLLVDSLDIKFYGNQDWFSDEVLRSSASMSSKLTFTSDYFISYRNRKYNNFNDKFYSFYKYDSNRNVLYGYDLTNYLLQILNRFGDDVYSVTQAIKSRNFYNGFHNFIYFDNDRINNFINIVKFKNYRFRLIKRYTFSDN